MFDVGFWEIAIISLIALIILGPERLPRAARTMGLWVGKARRMLAEVKRDIDRELDAADMKKIQEIKDEVKDTVQETVQESKEMFESASIKQDLDDAKSALEETATTLNEKTSFASTPDAEPPKSEKAEKPEPVADKEAGASDPSKTVA